MEQIERITYMEDILDQAQKALKDLAKAAEAYNSVRDQLQELREYYESPLWREDFEADAGGKLPADLKRGVLSEDAVYDLLTDRDQLLSDLRMLDD